MQSLNYATSIGHSLAVAFQISTRWVSSQCSASLRHTGRTCNPEPTLFPRKGQIPPRRLFSSTSQTRARKRAIQRPDRRITLIRYHLHHPTTLTPRPLRFSRTRHLRHWTIHRAWQLFINRRRRARELELERQYNAMREACEELRTGTGDGGKLFRKSMIKKGLWQLGAIPKEYTRGQVEYWGVGGGVQGKKGVWNEHWKRVGPASNK